MSSATTTSSDGPDRLGPVREGGDRLRAADAVHLVDAGEGSGRQRDGRHAAVGVRGYAECDLGDARHTRGDRRHEHGRGIAGAATGHVQPGSIYRHDELAEQHAVPLYPHVASELSFVVCGDFLARVFEGGTELGRCVFERGEQLVARHAQVVDGATVELLGQIAKCIVTAAPDLGDDRTHALDGRRVDGLPARRQRAEVGVRAAKIES